MDNEYFLLSALNKIKAYTTAIKNGIIHIIPDNNDSPSDINNHSYTIDYIISCIDGIVDEGLGLFNSFNHTQ